MWQGLCNSMVFVCLPVCPIYIPLQQCLAGLLFFSPWASDIDGLLQQAMAHSSTKVSSRCEQCHADS